jgi:hypothetical protein
VNEIYITTQNLIMQQKKSIPTAPQDGKNSFYGYISPDKKVLHKRS